MKTPSRNALVILVVLFLGTGMLTSCATVKQNIDGRANLAKCTYSLDRIELADLTIKNRSFDTVSFDVFVKVDNTSPTDVALDRIEGTALLDGKDMLTLAHKRFLRINKGKTATEPVRVELPLANIVSQLGRRPDTIGARATIWMNILLGEATLESDFSITVSYSMPIPWDAIQKMVEDKLKAIADEEARKAREKAATEASKAVDNAADALKSKLNF